MKVSNFKKWIIALMMLFISWGDFQIFGLYFFVIFQCLLIAVVILKSKICINKLNRKDVVRDILICLILTAVSGFFSPLPDSYKGYSLVMTVVLIPSFLCYKILKNEFKKDRKIVSIVTRYIRVGFLVQILAVPIQKILYTLGIDINKIIFNNILHLMESPTFFRQGEYFPSGFVWHSAMLAPLMVLSFLIFDNKWIRVLVLIDAFICGNSTTLVGVFIVAAWLWLPYIMNFFVKRKLSSKTILMAVVVLGILIIVSLTTDIMSVVINKITYLQYRLFQGSEDSSSAAHFSYYTLYPKVIENNSLINVLFGTGYGSSGYSISAINGQYIDLLHWEVESDFMNILISRGIIGFICYYSFLLRIAFKGMKIDRRYLMAIIVIIIQGFAYNIQFEYLFFIELIMYACIECNNNFFTEKQDPFLLLK